MSIVEAFILGMVQGVTEFLPISSSAHLVVVPWLFGWEDPGLAFDVFLHLGTLFAIVFYFFGDLLRIVSAGIQSILERKIGYDSDRQMFWWMLSGSVPAALAGALLAQQAESVFRAPLLTAITLSGVGFIMFWVDGQYPTHRSLRELSFKDVLAIGCAQAFAIVPGVSRSGSTISMARYLGFNRESAARFSFLLSVPIIVGALLFELKPLLEAANGSLEWGYLLTGFCSSLVFGFLSIHFLLSYLRNSGLSLFVWYRLVLAIVILIFSVRGG